MRPEPPIDCIVVGYHERDFLAVASQTKSLHTGAAHEIRANSVPFRGKRVLYMDLLNTLFQELTGVDPALNVFETPSLGVCYLKNFLEQRGLRTRTVNFFTREKARLRELLDRGARTVAITTTFYTDNAPISEIVRFVRECDPGVKIVVGGPHIYNILSDYDRPTQEYAYRDMGADVYITDSQGENTLVRLLLALEAGSALDEVPNLVYFDGDSPRWTPREPEKNDLNRASIRWESFDPAEVAPVAYMRTARSCPFACLFCNYPTLAGSHDLAGLEVIERELDALHAAGTEVIVFIDDTFNVPLPRFKKILQLMVDKRYGFKWFSFLRCSNVDEAAIDLMKASGCTGVLLGIESGDQTMLDNMNKSAKRGAYLWGIDQLHRRGIATYTSLICGFPGETEETVKNTIAFMQEAAPTFYNVQLYYHDVRTPIQRKAGLYDIQGGGYTWRHRTMNWRQASEWALYMYRNIDASIPIPLIGFSLWGVAYLVGKGFSIDQVKELGSIVKNLYIPGLEGLAVDSAEVETRLKHLLGGVRLKNAMARPDYAATA